MKNANYILIILCMAFMSCNNDDTSSKEEESQNLTTMYNEIITASMAKSTPCTNKDEWAFTAIGSKACGGPNGYIPYSLKINVTAFLKNVENYNNKQAAFNTKWKIVSTCDVPQQPSGVDCADGKPILVYSDLSQ